MQDFKRPCPELSWGQKVGGQIQDRAQGLFKSWTGWGDYEIGTNSLIAGGGGGMSAPQITQISDREIRVKYREYVGDVFTHPTVAGAFYNQAYAVNPGLLDTFPWVSSLAQNYQQWKPNGIIFAFSSTSGDSTAALSLGKVIMASDYNTTTMHTDFVTPSEMLNEAYSQETAPTHNSYHGIECAPSERSRSALYFCRAGTPSSIVFQAADYDICQFNIATVGGPYANSNLGSLYVYYDFSFFKNTLYNGIPSRGLVTRWWSGTVGITPATPYGVGTPLVGLLPAGIANGIGAPRLSLPDEDFVISVNGSSLNFPRWATVGSLWRFVYHCAGATTLNVVSPTFAYSGLAPLTVFGSPGVPSNTNTSMTHQVVRVSVNTSGSRPSLGIISGLMPATLNQVNFWISQMPDNAM